MKTVGLKKYEIEALVQWHRDQQFECANKEDYVSADDHKKRADELSKLAIDA